MIKRRPQMYPAFLSEVHYVLHDIREGAVLKRKNDKFYISGYEVQIKDSLFSFMRYDKPFMILNFKSINSDLSYVNLRIVTPIWMININNDYQYYDMEMPITKDDHFNLSTLHAELPEWEDMQKINSIISICKEIGVSRLKCESDSFYP